MSIAIIDLRTFIIIFYFKNKNKAFLLNALNRFNPYDFFANDKLIRCYFFSTYKEILGKGQ